MDELTSEAQLNKSLAAWYACVQEVHGSTPEADKLAVIMSAVDDGYIRLRS